MHPNCGAEEGDVISGRDIGIPEEFYSRMQMQQEMKSMRTTLLSTDWDTATPSTIDAGSSNRDHGYCQVVGLLCWHVSWRKYEDLLLASAIRM